MDIQTYTSAQCHNLLIAALKAKTIIRPGSCAKCQAVCRPVAHHPDYSRPLSVVWLCRSCHALEHGLQSPEPTANALAQRRWRLKHPDEYRQQKRVYMREYMRRKRGGSVLVAPVDAVAGKPLLPGPVLSGGVGRIEALPDVEPLTRRRWAKMIQEQRERHISKLGLASDEAVAEWLETLPA